MSSFARNTSRMSHFVFGGAPRRAAAVTLVALAGFVSACGDSEEQSAGTPTPSTPAAQQEPAARTEQSGNAPKPLPVVDGDFTKVEKALEEAGEGPQDFGDGKLRVSGILVMVFKREAAAKEMERRLEEQYGKADFKPLLVRDDKVVIAGRADREPTVGQRRQFEAIVKIVQSA